MLERPRSRRQKYLWPIAITLVVLAGLGLARINEQAEGAVDYLEGIRRSTDTLMTPAASLISLSDRIVEVDRAEFLTVTGAVEEALASAASTVEQSPAAPELLATASLYRVTLATWQAGLEMFTQGVIELADGSTAGGDRLAIGLHQLAAGDQLYEELRQELEREDVPRPITPVAAVAFLPEGVGLGSLARLYTVAASASNSLLALRADLAISSVRADPEWVANTEGILVVRETELLTIGVVVANNGNAPAPSQAMLLELVSPESQEVRTVAVPELEPGAQTTVTIPELAVSPGGAYQLQVRLELTITDADPSNNAQTFAFLINEGTE
jgi:hypothetical protein